ncbi:MAG TPA: ABC transporter permease [Anaerohalosphaeraceae bacterium]|nr:ABC transporter permease [Anaerohalosphaeraceae bacterium]HPB93473.1 ABC transporter permease [Anaerohalosphaeraceae bacterium]HRT23830.1 ABC transporter permease [Anaerohalosphaeraceae bacterium]HRU15499.1 ABC transporter permease [Anaerohalosphaeraceae bacterium]
MTVYIFRRLLYTVPIVVGVLLLTFFLFSVVGGDISPQIAGKNADAQTIAEIRHEYGFDKPLFLSWDSQFVNHFRKALTFQFGRALDREKISEKILRGVGPSLSLTIPMFLGTLVLSLTLALLVAFVRGSWLDMVVVILCVAGMSIPYLSFIIYGQYFFAYKLGWFPILYMPEESLLTSLTLPVLIGIIAGLGGNLRFYRTVVLDEMRSDYVRTAFAKGLSTTQVLFKHVLKNALIPIITSVVLSIPYLFLGSLLLERFFGIPGLGSLMIEAIASRDFFIINAMTFIFSLLIVVFTLLTDICYAWADPRIKLE